MSELRKALKFHGVLIWIGLSRQLLEIFPNELIDARSENLGPAACTKDHIVVDRQGDVHITHITCARNACQATPTW